MKISCPSCSAKYSISDEKVISRLAKIRCRKCGSTIVIDGKVNPPHVTTTSGDAGEAHEAAETSGGPEYSVDLGDGNQRTMPLNEIVAAYNAGQITGETFVWADGFEDWKPLADVQDIVDALHAAASGSRPQAAPAPSPWDAKPAAAAPARAAARPARGGSSDLFGRIERAGSEEDVATSAPEPAGLGGGGGAGTGARNESSVLFSLSALTSAAATTKPSQTGSSRASQASSPGGASRDDSGLIDLKALTAAAVKSDGGGALGGMAAPAMAPLAPSPLGAPIPLGAPLGLGSPLGGVAGDLAPPQKSKTGLFIAIGIVAAAVIVAVAFILRPAPPPVVVAPPPVPTPAPAPTPTPTPTLAATPPATGSAASEEEPPGGDKKKVATSGGTRRPSGGGGSKKPSTKPESGGGDSAPTAAPKPKTNNCGCAPVDLNCHMRCKTKGG